MRLFKDASMKIFYSVQMDPAVSKLCANEFPDKLLSSPSEALHLHRPRTRDRNAENTEQPIRM